LISVSRGQLKMVGHIVEKGIRYEQLKNGFSVGLYQANGCLAAYNDSDNSLL